MWDVNGDGTALDERCIGRGELSESRESVRAFSAEGESPSSIPQPLLFAPQQAVSNSESRTQPRLIEEVMSLADKYLRGPDSKLLYAATDEPISDPSDPIWTMLGESSEDDSLDTLLDHPLTT